MESPAERRRRRRRVPDATRKRAPRACDRCKMRKNKCVETESGTCVRCIESSHMCRFDGEPSLEGGVVNTGFESAKATLAERTIPAKPNNAVATHREEERSNIKSDISPAASTASEAFMWPRFLSRLRDAFCLDSQPAPDEQDMTGLRTRQNHSSLSEPGELRRVRKAVDGFPPRAVANFLVSVCVSYGIDVFFYFDQIQFIAELDQFYNEPASALRLDSSFVCLSLAIFALGSQWTALAQPGDADNTNQRDDPNFDPGRIFYDQARSLIPDVIDRSCVRSIQATFILGVYLMPASAISASYVYMGLALRKALAIGLHQEPDDSVFGPEEQETRRRLWWSIYSLERTMTIKLNRPRSISQDIISAHLPQRTPRDSIQKFDNIQHQIANVEFVLIIDKLSQPGAWSQINQVLSATELSKSLDNARDCLKKWKKDLPPLLRLPNVDPKSSSYRAVFHLHLNYHFASIDMGKVSVVTVVRARLRNRFRPHDEPQSIGKDVERSSDTCIKAAKKMIELFEGLRRSCKMPRFSFTDFQGCSVATIILLLAGILNRDTGYEGRIAFGLECLRRMACGGHITAQMGVRFIETLQSITNEARCKLLATQPGQEKSSSTPAGGGADDYGRWAEWIANAERVHDSSDGESELRHAEELSHNVTSPLPLRGVQLAPWDESAALQLQDISASDFALRMDGAGSLHGQHSAEDGWMPSFAWTNDQMYLMGLTGMGVLDFTDLS